MKTKSDSNAASLYELLRDVDEDLKMLFVKVMNLHAGFQIEERTQKQLIDTVRGEIEKSLGQ